MFSSISTRDRLRRSMSTRSMRRTRPAREPEPVDPEIAKAQAKAAASRAMRSNASSTESKAYERLGGPAQIAIPRRRPGSSLQSAEENASVYSASIAPPVTPRQAMERNGTNRGSILEESAALPPITELQGLDGRDSSLPSSYRRLRKARSMFSTRARSSPVPYVPPPISPRNACELDRSPEIELPRTLRPAISFVGGRHRGSRAIRHAKSHDAAIEIARSQFMEEAESSASQARRSSFLTRHKREHRPFRKTFRVASDTGPTSGSSPGRASRWTSRSRSRHFSSSIRNGFRRVFGFSKPAEQQSELSLGVKVSPITASERTVEHHPAERELGAGIDMEQYMTSSPLPVESPGGDSLYTSKSRVTSWADSSVANTVMTRKTRHRQSLSLIEEHGDLNKQLPHVPADHTHRQLPVGERSINDLYSGMNADSIEAWADSNDLYSALMQQIRRRAVHTPDDVIVFGTVPEHRVIPERTSSVYSHRSRRTIRHIPSRDSSTPGSFATARVGTSKSPQRRQPVPLGYTSGTISKLIFSQDDQSPLHAFSGRKSPRSPDAIGEEPDEDTESVVISRFEAMRTGTKSPSVYSRTTSGNTPTKGSSGWLDSIIQRETGTATIFASQRAIYSSPTRTDGSIPPSIRAHASADWQKWMDSQIERIEQASPTREHRREDAQFADDDDDIFMGMLKRGPAPGPETDVEPYVPDDEGCNGPLPQAELKPLAQNNFSRPFSRASSVRTILPSLKIPPLEPMHNLPNPSGAEENSEPPVLDASPMSARAPSNQMRSPIRSGSSNMRPQPESPSPHQAGPESQKGMWTREQSRRYSARRPIASGKPSQSRSMRSLRHSRGMNNENTRQQEEHDDLMDDYHKLQDTHSTISSKRMVEMFLDSRRRKMGREASRSTAAEEAFI